MTRIPMGSSPAGKALPNVYTALLAVAIIVMLSAVFVVGNLLMAPVGKESGKGGYELSPGDLFGTVEPTELPEPKK